MVTNLGVKNPLGVTSHGMNAIALVYTAHAVLT